MKIRSQPLPILFVQCALVICACCSPRGLAQKDEDRLSDAEQQALLKRFPTPNYAEKLDLLTYFPIKQNPASTEPSGLPLRMALGPDNSLYISEANEAQVLVLELDGGMSRRIGARGRGLSQFLEPSLLGFASNSKFAVWDSRALRIQLFDRQGDFVSSFRLFMPCSSMTVDNRGYIYLSFLDAVSNDRPLIDVYDLSGRHLGQFGRRIQASSPFFNEVDLSISEDGILVRGKPTRLLGNIRKVGNCYSNTISITDP
jgi:hypothetical protein